VRHLMWEIQSAAARLGHTLTDDFLQKRYDITPPMGAYQPSSLVDYLAGREVEIEPIWGEPLRRGEAAGAALPRLALLYALIGRLVTARKPSVSGPREQQRPLARWAS
jgi:2-dehydropantoate 2-reductase